MKKTNVILKGVTQHGDFPKLRVKLDGQCFPYVILNNEKILICRANFPIKINIWGNEIGYLEIVSGFEELKKLLANPDLTTDKLSLKQLARTAG